MEHYDVAIVGTGPAGLGTAFALLDARPELRIVIIDRNEFSSGGLRNDCKMNFSWPVGFPEDDWNPALAEAYLSRVEAFLAPSILERRGVAVYAHRAERLGIRLLDIRQAHLGTDGGLALIKRLVADLQSRGVEISLGETVVAVDAKRSSMTTNARELSFNHAVIAPGRAGFSFLQDVMR
ncbi:MAG: FAD-dependent oxidoreductase, partial [Spirochaetales bacterium]|nr:FAD-dependent oxidoreductase [Spirochaetales bacterium]